MESPAPPSYDGMDIVRPHPLAKPPVGLVHDTARGFNGVPPSPRGHLSHASTSSGTSNSTRSSPHSSLSGGGSRHGSFVSQTGGGSPDRWKQKQKKSDHSTIPDGDESGLNQHETLESGVLFGSETVGGTSGIMAERQPSVDELLRDSVLSFHRDGPLVNPLEAHRSQGSGSGGWTGPQMQTTSTRDEMQFVADAKGFDYGIFWKLRNNPGNAESGTYDYDVGLDAGNPGINGSEGCMSLFIQTSRSMYPSWVMGFGMAGRVGYTGNYEWHETIDSLPAWSFQRLRQASNAGIRTIISVPTKHGVVEFGATRVMPHNVSTVQYIQKLMGAPVGGQR